MARCLILFLLAAPLLAQTTLVNAGGAAYTDAGGRTWAASNAFSGETAFSTTSAIDDTSDDTLYQSGVKATSSFSYSIEVASGLFRVRLLFAEIEGSSSGRLFNVVANSQTFLSNLDVLDRAGATLTAYEREFIVAVTGTTLALTFSRVAGDPFINAMEITRVNAYTSAAADPATCGVGEYFFNTTTSVFKICTAADTWSPSAGATTEAGLESNLSDVANVFTDNDLSNANCILHEASGDLSCLSTFTFDGSQFLLPLENDAVTPTFGFGDGDSGLYETVDDTINLSLAGSAEFQFTPGYILSLTATGGGIRNVAVTGTTPTILPRRNDTNTGLGSSAGDFLSFITGGLEAFSVDSSQDVTFNGGITAESYSSSSTDPGLITLLEGTVCSAPTGAGEHSICLDSADSFLTTIENGGSARKYPSASDVSGAIAMTDAGVTTVTDQTLIVRVLGIATAATVADEHEIIYIPASLNGYNLSDVDAYVDDDGATGTLNIDLARCAAVATGDACSGTVADMLSTNLTIDTGEQKSSTAAAAVVIDTANDDVATDQAIRVDIDAIHTGTASNGLQLHLKFTLP